jgi:hypothetical protein
MDAGTFTELLTPAGQAILAEIQERQPKEADYLAHFQVFSRRYPAHLVQIALEVAILRGRAVEKFPQGDRMYFNRQSLEQSSSYPLAAHRARRYQGFYPVLDLGCSAGGDTLALAEHGPVIGIDLDPLRLLLAKANLSGLGLEARAGWVQADITRLPVRLSDLGNRAALFFDPARRSAGRRLFSVEAYHPPLSTIRDWLLHIPHVGVKLSPGVNLEELSPYEAAYEPEIEFISLDGELKEALLWVGSFRSAARRATLLAGKPVIGGSQPAAKPGLSGVHSLHLARGETLPQLSLSPPLDYLYEPDPAVLRAGLVALLGDRLQAAQLDPDIAYLTGAQLIETPFARSWAVQDWFPFQLKRLRSYLRARSVGRVTVKKRGSPLDPQDLARQLRLQGEAHALLFLTHLDGKPIVIVAA